MRQEPAADTAVELSPAYDQALHFARVLHAAQRRKSNGAPYLSHLLEVSGLVLEYGGDEAQGIAALLHDAIEDQADAFGGAARLRETIAGRFGTAVLRLVDLCSDCDSKPKPPWAWRKQQHTARLAAASAYECMVPACDKLHNLRCLNSELRAGRNPFRMLKAGAEEQLRHLAAVVAVFCGKGLPMASELRHELAELKALLADRRPESDDGFAVYAIP